MVARAGQAGLRLTPRQVFAQPTLAALAHVAEDAAAPEAEQAPPGPLVELSQAQLDHVLSASGIDDQTDGQGRAEAIYPLSPLQQGMLFDSLQSGLTGMYANQIILPLEGDFDPERFTQAWRLLAARHAVLRTAFVWEGLSQPVQVVDRDAAPPIEQLDWRSPASDEALQQRLQAFAADELERGFDLARAPLMRLRLIQFAPTAFVFVWTYHHILLDGWSVPLVLRDLFDLYAALSHSAAPELLPAPPYRDYIAWLQRQDPVEAAAYWRVTLADLASPTYLSEALARDGATDGPALQQIHLQLAPETTAALEALARRSQMTLNTLVQGAWAMLLGAYTGSDDIVFGATVAGRPYDLPDIETAVGLFTNTLPVRARIRPEQPLVAWLHALQDQQVTMLQHQYSSLGQVQRWSGASHAAPLFDTLLAFENFPVDQVLQGVSEAVDGGQLSASGRIGAYPLTLVVVPGPALTIQLDYLAGFAPAQMQRLLAHVGAYLEAILAGIDGPVGAITPLSAAELAALRATWSTPMPEPPPAGTAHALFAEQARRTPDAVALVALQASGAERRLSYTELDRRANQLAHYLRRRGVGPETLVAIGLERSPELIISVLGVLKAGAAYLPLDPSYPRDRLAFMLADSRATLLLTDRLLADRLPPQPTGRVMIDAEQERIAREPAFAPADEVGPDALAYLIYTSGSTGTPKGVMVPHRGIGNLALAQRRAFDLDPQSRVLQFASFGFDASVSEIFVTLLSGAALYLPPQRVIDGLELTSLLREAAISAVTLPPSLLAVLPSDNLPALRTVVTAGEACPPAVAERWATGRRLVNGYGPTETTVCATMALLAAPAGRAPIGRPIEQVQTYVLDRWGRPTPAGVPGELYIGGVGVARGYLGRPDLTAERFVPDPFGATPGARRYRTGDRVRLLASGELEFLDRIDQQVKLRGFRVELGEIEAALLRHPAVRAAAVTIREDSPGNSRLVAYLVPAGTEPADGTELRAFLAEQLPAYMLPTAFVALERLPLTPNGKLDRRALPAPEQRHTGAQSSAGDDEIEQQLVRLWEELFATSPISASDNFFELGGHSLLALQMQARIQQSFGTALPVAALLEAPTIAQLAGRLREATAHEAWPTLITIRAEGSLRPLFLVSPGAGNVLSYQALVEHLDAEQPVYVLQAPSIRWEQEPYPSIEAMAAHYIATIRASWPEGPYSIGGWSFGGLIAYEMAQQLAAQDAGADLLVLLDTQVPEALAGFDAELLFTFYAEQLDVAIDRERLLQLSYPEQLDYFFGLVQAAEVLPPELDLATARRILNITRVNATLSERYALRPYSGPVVFFRARKRDEHGPKSESLPAWKALCGAGLQVYEIGGTHQTFLTEPYVKTLAKRLEAALAKARAAQSGRGRSWWRRGPRG